MPLLAAGAVAFFAIGVLQALYGPAFPFFQARYGVDLGTVGLIASLHFLGSATAQPLVGLIISRLSMRKVVASSVILMSLGASLIALAPVWSLALAGALLAGFGVGGVSAGLNTVYASVGTRAVNLVNAIYGVGSIIAPLLLVGLAGFSLSWPFLTVTALCGLTLLAARVWGIPDVPPITIAPPAGRAGLLLVLFGLLLICYVGLEVGLGAWLAKHLQSLGVGQAALVLSGFWGTFTLGRILTGFYGGRVAPSSLVLVAGILTTLCALVAVLGSAPLAIGAYLLAGLVASPIFGTTLAWVTHTLPARFIPFLLVSGNIGGVVMPALLGLLSAQFGIRAIPLGLAMLGGVLCSVILFLRWLTRARY